MLDCNTYFQQQAASRRNGSEIATMLDQLRSMYEFNLYYLNLFNNKIYMDSLDHHDLKDILETMGWMKAELVPLCTKENATNLCKILLELLFHENQAIHELIAKLESNNLHEAYCKVLYIVETDKLANLERTVPLKIRRKINENDTTEKMFREIEINLSKLLSKNDRHVINTLRQFHKVTLVEQKVCINTTADYGIFLKNLVAVVEQFIIAVDNPICQRMFEDEEFIRQWYVAKSTLEQTFLLSLQHRPNYLYDLFSNCFVWAQQSFPILFGKPTKTDAVHDGSLVFYQLFVHYRAALHAYDYLKQKAVDLKQSQASSKHRSTEKSETLPPTKPPSITDIVTATAATTTSESSTIKSNAIDNVLTEQMTPLNLNDGAGVGQTIEEDIVIEPQTTDIDEAPTSDRIVNDDIPKPLLFKHRSQGSQSQPVFPNPDNIKKHEDILRRIMQKGNPDHNIYLEDIIAISSEVGNARISAPRYVRDRYRGYTIEVDKNNKFKIVFPSVFSKSNAYPNQMMFHNLHDGREREPVLPYIIKMLRLSLEGMGITIDYINSICPDEKKKKYKKVN